MASALRTSPLPSTPAADGQGPSDGAARAVCSPDQRLVAPQPCPSQRDIEVAIAEAPFRATLNALPAAEVRRSSRAGKQRVLMINGHPVLKVNNYDLHDSSNSLSVFDYELKKKKRAKSDAAMGTSLQTIR
ncbi:hypothetical protein WJX73_001595 [Symbiochloris irregularis]|uniref:Uncharacterized protein n=1 Tax=Symbiochloris irregularis TaxID=706552 RepID=A0AAW1NZ82_9CHLO